MAPPFVAGAKLRASELQNMVDDIADLNTGLLSILANYTDTASVATNQTTSSATYVDLATAGPSVTLTSTGTRALILWRAHGSNNTANCGAISSVGISGATTLAVSDANGILWHEHTTAGLSDECSQFMLASIVPGTNTYKMFYKRAAGGTAAFERRHIFVFAP